ncbi:hypothetical protein ElyMa_006785800 [Elysia marginata]|uniref:Uncharacterized protein n=1 Tax=Elysia marginata TaxID=1093978 RepID=A0AAV4J182_9GAST|nr:hypothetical protein ElyMa_006785800 [Elysia marginata]
MPPLCSWSGPWRACCCSTNASYRQELSAGRFSALMALVATGICPLFLPTGLRGEKNACHAIIDRESGLVIDWAIHGRARENLDFRIEVWPE